MEVYDYTSDLAMILEELQGIRELILSFHSWFSYFAVIVAVLIVLYLIIKPFIGFFK